MRIQVKPRYQPVRECSLDEVNSMLACGELVGDDAARTPESESWTILSEIPNVSIPPPVVAKPPEPSYPQPAYSVSPYRKSRARNSIDRLHGPSPTSQHQYRSPNPLSWFLIGLLGLYGMLTASLLSIDVFLTLQPGDAAATAELEPFEVMRLLVLLCTFLVIIFTYTTFGWWIVRTNKNVRALGAVGLRESPGWALGWFFVPLFCIWRPYIAMKQLWHASHDPAGWAMHGRASFVALWWTLWLASNGLGQWNARLQFSTDPHDVLKEKLVNFSAGAMGLASITTAALLVYYLNRAQIKAKNSMLLRVAA
jgi:hypothetical protein